VPSKQLASHPDLPVPVLLQAVASARRMRLRFDERERVLKLTHPRGVRPAAALAWAATQKRWIDEQIERALPAEPFVPGAILPIAGEDIELCWAEAARRTPSLAGGKLICGGPQPAFARRIEQYLKRLAAETLSRETAEIAAAGGYQVSAVSVGDARTRWGSCSSGGRIRYNWRLIFADPQVRRYVVAHEVAHLEHLDHGPRFKALERALFGGDTRPARELLRSSGPRLRRIGLGR
jgi:predicted metal-dependent hydrolase